MHLTPNPSDDDLCRLLDACGLHLPEKRGPGRPPQPIPHGTAAGARVHQYRKEAACGLCARAYRAYQRGQYAARKNRHPA